jgi:hypothetical protein
MEMLSVAFPITDEEFAEAEWTDYRDRGSCADRLKSTIAALEQYVDMELAVDAPQMDPWIADEEALAIRLLSL